MTKLSTSLVHDHLLRESEEEKASYTTMKAPKGKSKEVDAKNLGDRPKMTKITQVEVPSSHKSSSKKSKGTKGEMGIPQANMASGDDLRVPNFSMSKPETSPKTPAVKKSKPNQTSKQSEVKKTIQRTEEGKGPKADTIPQAEMAGKYTSRMPHGNSTLKHSGDKVPEVDAPNAENLGGTTSPSHKPAKMKTKEPGKQSVSQIKHPGGSTKNPPDAPKKPSWETQVKGHNVMESVSISINGKPKASFGVIHRDVASKLVEQYQSFGYDVEVVRSPNGAAWKRDRQLLSMIHESIDAHYNNAPVSSRRARKAAMNRFFEISQTDYNSMYESKRHFATTLKAAFERIMEAADLKYRRKLQVMEGIARVQVGDDVVDLDLITQARDTPMALRNFRNEIVEEYGFNAKIKHLFVEGEKFRPTQITEWAETGRNK